MQGSGRPNLATRGTKIGLTWIYWGWW